MPRSAPALPRELLRYIFLQELSEEGGLDWWAESNGRRFSLVCRDWVGPGQDLAFYRPTLSGYYRKDPLALFAKHLERFPHLAKLVRDLRLTFNTDTPVDADVVRSILQRCDRVTQIQWPSKLDLLTAELSVLPFAKLTDLRLGGCNQQWDISALLRTLPQCARLRSLSLSLALSGDSPSSLNAAGSQSLPLKTLRLQTDNGLNSAASSEAVFYQHILCRACPEALTTLSLTLHLSNFDTLSRWVEQCTNLEDLEFCLVEDDPTDRLVKLTSMVSHLMRLRTLKLTRQVREWASWDEDDYRRTWALDELAAALSDFFNALPPTLVELVAEIWAPAGECYNLVKTFLRTHLHDSLLEAVSFDAEVKKFGRVQLEATRSHELAEDSIEAKWWLSYKHWEGCSCGDWDSGSWELDGPDAAEYEVLGPSVELDWSPQHL